MDHNVLNHLQTTAPVFPPAASSFPVPVHAFPTPPPHMPPQQQAPLGDVVPEATNFLPVNADYTLTLYSTSPSTQPSYPQMITEAIVMLRERDGSSRQAIAKYIERVYPNLPQNHSGLLTQHLKRMKDTGELVMVKHSYVLASSAPAVLASSAPAVLASSAPAVLANLSESIPTPQPPQPSPLMDYLPQAQQAPVQEPPINNVSAGPGPVTVPEALFASIGLVDGQLDPAPVPKKRPGRPKKVVGPGSATPTQSVTKATDDVNSATQPMTDVAVDSTAELPAKRRPGRPPRNASKNIVTASTVTSPRGRGRPKQNGSVYTGKPRGRPRRNVEATALVNADHGGDTEAVPTAVHVGDGAVTVGRKRGRPGRPPKFANELQKPRNLSSGRPVGRPKRNEPAGAVQVSNLQQLLAYQELKSKLDFFQSRIKHNVGILKPVLNSQSASIASGALQELEELGTLDINAASNLHALLQDASQNQV